MAKLYASEIAVEVANDAVQIFGGYGYTKDFPVEKFYRDAKLCTIGEVTSEIQKLVISREVLKAQSSPNNYFRVFFKRFADSKNFSGRIFSATQNKY